MNRLAIARDVPLSHYSTMRLGGKAAYAVGVPDLSQATLACAWAKAHGLPLLTVGSGSNIVWRDEGFAGLIIVNQIKGYELTERTNGNYLLKVGAGENWDSVVARATAAGLTGIECLSLVPGTAGATPVQNVGAYGQEIAHTLVSVDAYDTQSDTLVNLTADECGFGYRTSRFKAADHGRFIITGISLHLTKGNPKPPFYPALQNYLTANEIRDYTPQSIRRAVIAIRNAKLPNPNEVANNGSFFANPVVDEIQFIKISTDYDNVPNWPAGDGPNGQRIKLSAAWLMDQAGFKDRRDPETGMATWPNQTLVLINEHATKTEDLLNFRQKIIDAVKEKFGITLQQEPELLPYAEETK